MHSNEDCEEDYCGAACDCSCHDDEQDAYGAPPLASASLGGDDDQEQNDDDDLASLR
jgi:hypothetical protein